MSELDPTTEYADYLRSTGLSDDEVRDQIMFEEYQATGQAPQDDSTWYGKAGRGVLKALDYTSALGRGAIAGGIQEATGKNLGVNFHDVIRGDTPDTAELLRRGDVPEMDAFPDNKWIPSGRTMIGFAGDVLADPVTYIPFVGQGKAAATAAKLASKAGKAGEVATKAARVATRGVGDAIEGTGKSIWKSGFKRIDNEVAKYGKKPVSEVLMREGVTGTQGQVFNQMDDIGKKLLAERNDILKKATKAGAEVDVNRAMKGGRDFIAELKKIDDPNMMSSIPHYENTIDNYMTRASKEAEPVLRDLPTSKQQMRFTPLDDVKAYDAPTLSTAEGNKASLYRKEVHPKGPAYARGKGVVGEPIINDPIDEILSLPQGGQYTPEFVPGKTTVYDMAEAMRGPTPVQTSAWKSSGYGKVGDAAYQTALTTPKGQQFQIAINKGLKDATEESVGKSLGKEAQEQLVTKNDELGRILTSKERQAMDATAAANKDMFTSVDGLALVNPQMLAAKKAADLMKTTYVRTKAGKAMVKAAQNSPETFWRQLLLQPTDRDGLQGVKVPYRLPEEK